MLDFLACDTVNINMTSLQGKITTTYDKLVEVFGEPTMTDASPYEKVNAEWTVQAKDKDNTVFTVYNWKDGYIPTEKYDWHIGGFDSEAVDCVEKVLDSA